MESIYNHIVRIQDTINDYPDKIGLIVYVDECNLSCNYCYNMKQLQNLEPIDPNDIFEQIKISNYYDAVIICGGEPTLYNDLPNFVDDIKKLGMYVKIDTNGTNFNNIGNPDYVSVDYKWPLSLYQKYSRGIPNDIKSFLSNINKNLNGEIRTVVTHLHRDNIIDEMVDELYDIRNGINPKKWIINRYYKCQFVLRPQEIEQYGTLDLYKQQTYFYNKILEKFK